MSLTIGELVAGLRADERPFTRSLSTAELAMRGFTRDTNGRLRDMHGRFVDESSAMGRSFSYGIGRGVRGALDALKKVAPAVAAIGVGLPAVAAVTSGLLGLAAGAAAAGIAVKAFALAAGQQWTAVQDVAKLAEEAQAAAASGAEDAAEKQKAYTDALAQLPSATQDTARAFVGLKSDFKAWSDGLSGTTMPVFTKGIEILRDLLPMLTPFVEAAAKALSGFLDEVAAGVKSAGFKEWAADMATAAGPALSNFLTTIKNLAVGFGGLLKAFLPVSDGMTGGLANMTGAFAEWATGLDDSKGFATFMDLAREGGETFGVLAEAALEVLDALSPMLGITAGLAIFLADIINSMPPDLLLAIATGWVAMSLAIKAYGLYTRIAAAATRAWAMATALWSAIMMANPVGLIIAAVVALVAIIVIAWQKSETFRDIVKAVWAAIVAAVVASVDWIMDAVAWFAELPGKISSWFGQAKDWAIRKWNELLAWVTGLPGRVAAALSSLPGVLRSAAVSAGGQLVATIRQKLSDAIAWVKGLPGRARSALGSLGGILRSAGQSLIRGFIDGIKSMLGSVKDAAGSVVSAARDYFPFSPAKEGPFSGRGYTTYSGQALIDDFAKGVESGLPAVRSVLDGMEMRVPALEGAGPGGLALGPLPGASATQAAPGRVTLEVRAGQSTMDQLLARMIREYVNVNYGGDVQQALGRGSGQGVL